MKKIILILVLSLFLINISSANTYSTDPQIFVKELVNDAINKLSDNNFSKEEKKKFIENIAVKNVDINAIMNEKNYGSKFFYKLRNKLIRDKLLYTKFNSLKEFDLFFNNYKNDLINKYEINKQTEVDILGVNQEDYLNNYYIIVKNKFK